MQITRTEPTVSRAPKWFKSAKARRRSTAEIAVPPVHDWRTTDQDEINKRRLRARTEPWHVTNTDAAQPVFSNFRVKSASGMTYAVEIRDVAQRQFACDCPDFRSNGLGTCKHVEAVLLHLQARYRRLFQQAGREGSARIDLVPDPGNGTLRVERGRERLPAQWRAVCESEPEVALELLRQADVPGLRISQEVAPWLESRRQAAERKQLRREYEAKVQSGEWPPHETLVPLFPYQREGMLHLAFTERALLADEMGLGKTIQAIAACALLHRLGKAKRVLVVTPASLKTEWEEQIQKFTTRPYQIVFGGRAQRLQAYHAATAPFFTIVNYEQMLRDALDVNARLKPDVVVLDEAQRIKNWNTQTAQVIKRLQSRYAFVLTGTPIENRIDEIRSLIDFLNPAALGPLFRFNREYYELDDRGKPVGYRNLDKLHERIKPFMLRRRKAEVETELPERTQRNYFVPLSDEQKALYADHETQVARLINIAQRRPLAQQEQEKLQRELAMMRMVCDTNYILDPDQRACPKLGELEKILDECCDNDHTKLIIFSEWERMLELVRETCQRLDFGFAWHTGRVPQRRRRDEINLFKADPNCRVFLSTDSGSTGLNLQAASVVVNCDLPWNPARLEQRIARAWRKHQTRPVTVINLVAENTIEHRMLGTLAMKQSLADGVLDRRGDLTQIKLTSGRQAFLARLQQLVEPTGALPSRPVPKPLPADRAQAFCERALAALQAGLVRCEERYPLDGPHSVVVAVVERDAALWREKLQPVHQELFGPPDSESGLAPVKLEVIDRATDDAINRLIEAGLLVRQTRAARLLHPAEEAGAAAPALTEAERQQIAAHRQVAARKLKMARALGAEELLEETRDALLAALHATGRALAIQHRLPEPGAPKDGVLPPLALHWAESLPVLHAFLGNPAHEWKPVTEALAKALTQPE